MVVVDVVREYEYEYECEYECECECECIDDLPGDG